MKYTIITVILLVFVSACFAETIVLKSGEKIEGKIFERTDKYIKLDFEGLLITYFFDEIKSIDGKEYFSWKPSSGDPCLIPGVITLKEGKITTIDMLNNLENIMSKDSLNGIPGVPDVDFEACRKKGILGVLQSPKYAYNENEDMLLYLRLLPINKSQVVWVNFAGPVTIEILDLISNQKTTGRYSATEILKEYSAEDEKNMVQLGNLVPEVIEVFTFKDFGLPLLSPGRYQIQLRYYIEKGEGNSWIRERATNHIIIEITKATE